MKTQFQQMMDGLDDVEAFLAGEQEGFKAHVPHEVDVKAIRNRLGMTQAKFSATFGFSLDAIKHWEGGRRTPEAPARTLLTVIDKNPAAVLTALNPAPSKPHHSLRQDGCKAPSWPYKTKGSFCQGPRNQKVTNLLIRIAGGDSGFIDEVFIFHRLRLSEPSRKQPARASVAKHGAPIFSEG